MCGQWCAPGHSWRRPQQAQHCQALQLRHHNKATGGNPQVQLMCLFNRLCFDIKHRRKLVLSHMLCLCCYVTTPLFACVHLSIRLKESIIAFSLFLIVTHVCYAD